MTGNDYAFEILPEDAKTPAFGAGVVCWKDVRCGSGISGGAPGISDDADEVVNDTLDLRMVVTLGHDADEGLGSRRPDQQATSLGKLGFRIGNRLEYDRLLQRLA